MQYSSLIHRRLGHVGHSTLKITIKKKKQIDGVTIKTFYDSDLDERYSGCFDEKAIEKRLNIN